MKTIIITIVLSLMSVPVCFYAQPPLSTEAVWQKIGETNTSLGSENGSILISGTDKYRSLKLLTNAAINLMTLEAYYGSGEVEEIAVARELKAGEESQEIALKGCNKQLKKIIFTYKTVPDTRNEHARVELFGSK
jgi:hypothetical protein